MPLIKFAHAAKTGVSVHVGYTTVIIDKVRGQLSGREDRELKQADKVFFSENIITAGNSKVVLQFRDGSTLELGADAAMVIDELVFNPLERKSKKRMTLVQGAFRYVSAYVSKDNLVEIVTETAVIGIRGSAVSGFYYANTPTFVHVSNGSATYSNDSGETTIESGQSIAALGRDTPPMQPSQMPAAVAAQALAHVQATVGKASSSSSTQTLSIEAKAADAAANLLPLNQQGVLLQGAAASVAVDVPAFTPDIPLLTGAANAGLLSADASAEPTPEQQAFLSLATAAIPDAVAQLAEVTSTEQQQNAANITAGTAVVVSGVTENAQSTAQIAVLVQATVAANPAAAQVAAQSAVAGAANNTAISPEAAAQSAMQAVVAGAVEAGADVGVATQAATQGSVAGAAASGADIGAVTNAATIGSVAGANEAGIDTATITNAALAGAIDGAIATGTDVTVVTTATQDAAAQSGTDVPVPGETNVPVVETVTETETEQPPPESELQQGASGN